VILLLGFVEMKLDVMTPSQSFSNKREKKIFFKNLHSSCCFFAWNNLNVGSHDKVQSLPTNYNSGFFLSHVHCYPWRLTLLKFHPIILNDFTWKLKNFKIEFYFFFCLTFKLGHGHYSCNVQLFFFQLQKHF